MAGKPLDQNPKFVALAESVTQLHATQQEQGKKIDSLTDAVSTLIDTITEQRSTRAADRIVTTNRHFEAQEQNLGAEGSVEFGELDGAQVIDRPIELDTENFTKTKAEDLAFNNEWLEVYIHEVPSSDTKPELIFEIQVNGERELFRRGEKKRVRRKFVEGLARAKPITYANEEYVRKDGLADVRYPTHRGLRYPFSLVNPKPVDENWLQSILAQP